MCVYRLHVLAGSPISLDSLPSPPATLCATARKGVGRLVYFHFLLGVVEAGLAIMGASLIVRPSGSVECDEMWRLYRVDLIVALVAISQVADVMFRTCCCVVMAGSREVTSSALPIYEPHSINHVEQRWQVKIIKSTIEASIEQMLRFKEGGAWLNMQASADSPTDPLLGKRNNLWLRHLKA